jgi:hypothetical protein
MTATATPTVTQSATVTLTAGTLPDGSHAHVIAGKAV